VGDLIGYCDHLAIRPGEPIHVMVHTDQAEYESSIVRLIHGDNNPGGPGFREEDVAGIPVLKHPGRPQRTQLGSYAMVDAAPFPDLGSFTVAAWVMPTIPVNGLTQGLMSRRDPINSQGFSLTVDGTGCVRLDCHRADGQVRSLRASRPLQPGCWYFVAAGYDAQSGDAVVYQLRQQWSREPLVADASWGPSEATQPRVPFLIGAGEWHAPADGRSGWASDCFNGKLGAPVLFDRKLSMSELAGVCDSDAASVDMMEGLLARWDFGADQGSCMIPNTRGSELNAELVNMPTRGVTGHRWSGRESDFRLAPSDYDAIHFHADDVEDAGWEPAFTRVLPPEAKSGVYAVRLRAGDLEDRIPFVALPNLTRPATAPILVVMPTMTYLAYANLPLTPECQPGRPAEWHPPLSPFEAYMQLHLEFGKGLYERHDDGSGVSYSSARRPIVALRPNYRTSLLDAPRHLGADLYLIDWLETKGFPFEVATDFEVHAHGVDFLHRYAVVLTGSHPEYCTYEMLSALESYVGTNGRLMYLGGNGFYWVTTVHRERPDVIEVRRGYGGTRPWESEPGEAHHSTTGELGGHWRRRGRIPNRLTGVGMAAEGADGRSVGYRRLEGSFDPRANFIFEGIDANEVIGNFGLVMGGAVGDEVDRADHALGTPGEAIVLATSDGPLSYYSVVLEDRISWRSARQPGEARADMVYIPNPSGGAVFSVGSMSWLGSLSHNHYRNNVSRITENVLRRFSKLG
jgi:N,N-dimethylformamidase beta subunit-like protein/concanavalin A-like lectin/glucanase superfamily protein